MAKDYIYYLFDFDLTLADSSRGIVMCFTHVLHRHGYLDVTEMQIKRTIGKTLEESFAILTGVNDPAQLAAWKLEYTKEADIYMNDNTVLFPETVAVLTKLKEQGAKLAIISTKYRYRIQAVIDKHFPQNFIDVIIGGEDVKKSKPHPQGVKTALKRLKAKPQYALYVGDSTVDAETAKNAGVDFCGVLNGLTTYDELAVYPHRKILNNLTLLPLVQKDAHITNKSRSFIPAKWNVYRRAFNIKQIRGKKSEPKDKLEQHTCYNCGDVYEGDYCRSCGQPASTQRITLKQSFSNFFLSFLNIESGFLHTFYELWYRPGYMVMDFIRGHRKPYYKPFSLLIVMAATYIVAAHIFDPQSVGKEKEKISADKVADSLQVANKTITDSLQLSASKFPTVELDFTGKSDKENNKDKEDEDNKKTKKVTIKYSDLKDKYFSQGSLLYSMYDLVKGWVEDNQAFMFVICIPFYIFGTRRAFRHTRVNKLLNAGEYTFIFAYLGSQIIMKDTLLVSFYGSEATPYTVSYFLEFLLMTRNFKQLFQLDWKSSIKGTIKTYFYMTVSLVILIIVFATLIGSIAYGILSYVDLSK